MIYSGDMILAIAGNQLTTMLIAGGSIAALIVLFFCFKAMSRPVPGYHVPENPVSPVATPAADTAEQEAPVEKKSTGTPGFILPLPSQGMQQPFTSGLPQAAVPDLPQARPPVPSPAAVAGNVELPVLPTEQTVDIGRATAGSAAPEPLSESAARPMTLRNLLVFRNGSREGENIRLDSFSDGQCAIGRSDVPDNQVVIRDDLKVSRVQHAVITRDTAGEFFIRDNNSANKVFVNEQCIEGSPVLLNHGDKILIGLTEFEYLKEPVA